MNYENCCFQFHSQILEQFKLSIALFLLFRYPEQDNHSRNKKYPKSIKIIRGLCIGMEPRLMICNIQEILN